MKKILFINFGGLGDEILFLPAIKSVKDKFKDSKITLCLEKRSKAVQNLVPYIDDVICANIKEKGLKKYIEIFKMLSKIWFKGFDMVISSGKSPLIAILLSLTFIKQRVGYKTHNNLTNKLLTNMVELNENQYAGRMYYDLVKHLEGSEYQDPEIIANDNGFKMDDNLIKEGFIAIHPGVSKMSIIKNIYKCPDSDFWVDLIEKISTEKNKNVVLLGGPDDKEIIEEISSKTDKFINMYGKTKNIMDLAYIISLSEKFICADSAPLHIGVSLNKELIAFFGPTNENKLIPKKDIFHVITANVECRPCLWHKRQCNCEESHCLKFDIQDVLKYI